MRSSLLIGLISLFTTCVEAQNNYDVAKIPANLLQNASAVVRNEEQIYDLKSPGTATYTYKTAITILNKNAENISNLSEYYDKFSNIYSLKATMYDAKGTKIKEYKNSDFKDKSAVSDGSIYDDSRIKTLDFLNTTFPYTIEYSYSSDFTGIRYYPSWTPIKLWECAVEHSSYTFRIPKEMTFKYLKYKALKTDSALVKDKMEYKWACDAVPALEYEPMSTGLRNITPWVTLAPNQFEYDGSKGNLENWATTGSWLSTLSNGLQVLPEPYKLKVQQLVKDAKSPEQKVRILYNYLQQNTRYVGVQLGIGGYKPIAAEKVSAVNYSDCKGLSNLMKALLQAVEIPSNLVVIGNDMPSLNSKYASLTQANHMILCVPLQKDTLWLECTSHYTPAGFIGNGNSDKTVLLITDQGGKLAQTPSYAPAANYLKRQVKVDLNETGASLIDLETNYGNAQYEDHLGLMLMEPVDQKKRITNSLSIPNIEITAVNYVQPNKELPVLQEKISLKSTQLLTAGAGKLFLTLNLLNRQETALTAIENRKTGFAVNYGFLDEDEIVYNIPKGYKVEFLPKDVVIESEFGKYTAKAVQKDNTIIYTRSKLMTNKKYPAEKYNDYVAFHKKLYQADKVKSILAKID